MAATTDNFAEKEISFLTNNDPNGGALDVSPGFNRWSFEIPGGISFPDGAKNLTMQCDQASIWYNSHLVHDGFARPNNTGLQDKRPFNEMWVWENPLTGTAPPAPWSGGPKFRVLFSPGLWSLSALQEFFYQELTRVWTEYWLDPAEGNDPARVPEALTIPSWFNFQGQVATGKVVVEFPVGGTGGMAIAIGGELMVNLLGLQESFGGTTPENSPRNWIGYTNQMVPNPPIYDFPVVPLYKTGDNQAAFDALGSYLFNSSLCGGQGIPVNNRQGNVVAQIVPDVSSGQQILYRPPHPQTVDVGHLRGKIINQANFNITNEKGVDVSFNEAVNTFLLTFKWLEPIDSVTFV